MIAGFAVRPFARKSGAFSIADLIAGRFPGTDFPHCHRRSVAILAFALAHAGVEVAVRALNLWSGFARPLAAAVVGIVLVFMVAPGGFAGAIWGAIAAGAIFVSAFALPLIVLALGGNPLPFPGIGDQALWDRAVAQLSGWNLLGVEPSGFNLWIVVALAAGLSVLVPVVALSAFGAPDRRSAWRAGCFDSLAPGFSAQSSLSRLPRVRWRWCRTPLARAGLSSPALYAASKNGDLQFAGPSGNPSRFAMPA